MSSYWRPRNTWEKSRPLIPSGWSSLPRNFSASATPRNLASKRNSRKSNLYTTNTRIQTHGESRELSRNFTQKLPSEDIIVLLGFFCWTFRMYLFLLEHFRGTNDGQWILFKFTWLMCIKLCHVCMYYNASWSKLVHVLSPVGTIVLWWAFDLRSLYTHAIPIHLLYECFEKWKCFYVY